MNETRINLNKSFVLNEIDNSKEILNQCNINSIKLKEILLSDNFIKFREYLSKENRWKMLYEKFEEYQIYSILYQIYSSSDFQFAKNKK